MTERPTTINDLPLTKQIVARLYKMPAEPNSDEAKKRERQGLPVEGMTEAEAIRFATTGQFESR